MEPDRSIANRVVGVRFVRKAPADAGTIVTARLTGRREIADGAVQAALSWPSPASITTVGVPVPWHSRKTLSPLTG